MESEASTAARSVKPAELARELGVSRQAIHDLIRREILAVDDRGRIDVDQAKLAIVQCVRPSGKTAGAIDQAAAAAAAAAPTTQAPGDSFHVARTLKESALAGIAQEKLAKLEASLIDASQVIAAGFTGYRQLRAAVLPVAERLAPEIAQSTVIRDIQAAIDGALRTAFAGYCAAIAGAYSPELEDAAPAEKPDPNASSFHVARTRKEVAEARIAQLELAEIKGELIRKEHAMIERSTAFRQLRDTLTTSGRKLAALLATMTDAGEIRAKLDAQLREGLDVFEARTLAPFGSEAAAPPASSSRHDGFAEVMLAIAKGMQPDPELRLDEWSEAHVIIPKGSAFSGPYRLAHTPYARRVLQCLSPGHPCARVVVKAASQMLKTQVFINAALGWIDLAPANILALEPTDKLAKRLSARVSKAIEACDRMKDKVAKPRSRDAANTVDRKEFDGGAVHITTAGAAANLAEIPARYVFCDEVDRMEMSVNSEGDPVELAEARGTTYEGIFKAYHVSSPTLVGASKITVLHAMGTQEQYHVPCPHCGHLHALEQAHFHYDADPDTDNVTRAWFVCPDCGAEIEEHHKTTMLPDVEMGGQARWVATAPGDGETVSFEINAFYAPLGSITWLRLARQHARAVQRKLKGDASAMQVYENTRLAIAHNNTESTTTASALRARAEGYAMRTIPERALVLTMAVDTQPTRLEVQIEAWGPQLEHWILDYIVLHGDPSAHPDTPGSVWQRLDEIRRTPFSHASGAKPIPISAYAIDSGGANTQDVYNYGSKRAHVGCLIVKGANRPNRPIISSLPSRVNIEWNGTRTENGAVLWMIGTDVAKDYLHNRLKLADGAGAMHFPTALPDEWYEGFLAERPRIRYVKGHAVREWIKNAGDRNEPLDVSVYNLAVAYHLGLHRWTPHDWQRLRAKLVPANLTRDLFAEPAAPIAPPPLEPQLPAAPIAAPAIAPPPPPPAATPAPQPAPIAPVPAFMAPRPPVGRRIYSRGIRG